MQLTSTCAMRSRGVDQFFGTSSANLDSTYTPLMRLLALKRCGGDMEVARSLIPSLFTKSCSSYSDDLLPTIQKNIGEGNRLSIFYDVAPNQALSVEKLDGFERLNQPPFPVEQYLSQITNTKVFINKSTKHIILLVKKYSDMFINCVESIWFRIAVWLYPDNTIQDEEEVAIYRSLAEQNEEAFNDICDAVIQENKILDLYYKSALHGWNNRCKQEQISQLKSNTISHMDTIERLTKQINDYLDAYDKDNRMLELLLASAQENTDEVYNFFAERDYLTIEKIDEKRVYYNIVETIDGYSEDDLDRMISQRGSLYHNTANELTQKVIQAVFKKHLGVFIAESHFYMTGVTSISPLSHQNIVDKYAIPHPHLDGHACLGRNADFLIDFLRRGEWEMAIDQTVAATKNLNFSDGVVIKEFYRYINKYPDKKCIKTEDGVCSPREIAQKYDELFKEEE